MKPRYLVFTDGSVRTWGDNSAGAYSVVAVDAETMKYVCFGGNLKTKSSIYAEAWALYRGLQYIYGILLKEHSQGPVVLVTDNKINVEILTKFIHNWDISDWNQWKKMDGELVKNQELYRSILTLIGTSDAKLRLVHINSHLKENETKQLRDTLKSDGISVDLDTAKLFMYMNSMADSIASEITAAKQLHKKTKYGSRRKLVWEPISSIKI